MLGKGLKRKLEQENDLNKMGSQDDSSATCYWLQRQTVLNLSLLKLHSRPAHLDPGLARRVLITNTLRHIQEELRVEGVVPQSFPSAGSPLGVADRCWELPAGCGVESPSHTESSLTPVFLLEEDRHLFVSLQSSLNIHTPPFLSRNCPSLFSVINDSFASALAEIEDLCPTVGITTSLMEQETLCSPTLDQDVPDITSNADSSATCLGNLNKTGNTEPVHESMESNMDSLCQFPPSLLDSTQLFFNHSPSLLPDFSLDDFVFTEIDNFLLDNTACRSSPSTSAGPSKVMSLVTDDFVKTLTGCGSVGMNQSALPSNQTFKLDLNELDHVMEVLVGS